jgi:hypothetical protein
MQFFKAVFSRFDIYFLSFSSLKAKLHRATGLFPANEGMKER